MSKRVLVIEDEENLVELLKINMERRSYDVDIARDGEEGLRKVFARTPDAVLLNVRLPGIDGWEVCRRIRGNPVTKDVLIVFLTAAAQRDDRAMAEECGADYFMSKPFDMGRLLEIVSNAGELRAGTHHRDH